jgi:hypothetical protein
MKSSLNMLVQRLVPFSRDDADVTVGYSRLSAGGKPSWLKTGRNFDEAGTTIPVGRRDEYERKESWEPTRSCL